MKNIKLNFKNHLGLTVRGNIYKISLNSIVIFVHGFGGFMKDPQFQFYKTELLKEGYSVCMFDFTNGIGRSQRSYKTPFSYNDLKLELKQVIEFVRALGFVKIFLVGHSLGGAISIDLASDSDTVINKLCLINPLIYNTFNFKIKEHDFKITYHKHQNKFSNIFRILPNFSKLILDIEGFDIRNKLEKNKIPTLVIEGRYDKVIKFKKNKELFLNQNDNYEFKEYDFPHTFWSKRNRKILPVVTKDMINFFNK